MNDGFGNTVGRNTTVAYTQIYIFNKYKNNYKTSRLMRERIYGQPLHFCFL